MKIGFIQKVFIITVIISFAVMGKSHKFIDMLSLAMKDPVLTAFESEAELNQKKFGGIPGLDGIEFKIENKGFDEECFEYSLRFKPRAFGETKASLKFNKTILENNEYKQKMIQNTAIYERYLLFAYLMEYKTIHGFYEDLITLYDDRIKVMESQAHSEDFQLEKLIKEEKDRAKEWIACKEVEKYVQVLSGYTKTCLSDSSFTDFDTSDLVSMETIMNRIEKMEFVLDTNNPALDYYRSKLDMEKARFELEKVERHRYLDMISFSYDNEEYAEQVRYKNNNRDYKYRNAFGIELSFTLPCLTNTASDFNHRKAELLSEVDKYNRTKIELEAKVQKDQADLQQLIAQYRYLLARTTEVDAEASLQKYLQIEGMDPLVYLDVKENVLKNKIEMSQIKFAILRNYMYVLDNAGKLSEKPIRNYYSEKNEVVE